MRVPEAMGGEAYTIQVLGGHIELPGWRIFLEDMLGQAVGLAKRQHADKQRGLAQLGSMNGHRST